jgi:hypothetical protein
MVDHQERCQRCRRGRNRNNHNPRIRRIVQRHTLPEAVLARLPTWALRIQTGTGRLRMRRDTPSSLPHVALVSPRLKYMAPMARGQHTFARSHQTSTGYGYYTEGQLRKKFFWTMDARVQAGWTR